MFEFIKNLCESKLFPTNDSTELLTDAEMREVFYLYICSLRILLLEDDSEYYAHRYVVNTLKWNNFERWRTDGTDFYVMAHKVLDQSHQLLREETLVAWLESAKNKSGSFEDLTKRLFARLDFDLRITDSELRMIRRQSLNWASLSHKERSTMMEHLLARLRVRCRQGELYFWVHRVARREDLLEDADAGATAASDVATLPSVLGVPKTAKKVPMIRRTNK
jgi:hypothetical protein